MNKNDLMIPILVRDHGKEVASFLDNEAWFFQGFCDQYGRIRLAKRLKTPRGVLKKIIKEIKKGKK